MFFKLFHCEVFVEIERVVKVEQFLDWICDDNTIEVWIGCIHAVVSKT